MQDWQMNKTFKRKRQHLSALIITAIVGIRRFVSSPNSREFTIPLLVFMWISIRHLPAFFSIAIIIIFFLSFFFYAFLHWYNFYYYIEEGEIKIHFGIFVRHKSSIPAERIQTIDLSRTVLHRLFNVVGVDIRTAGESNPEATINAISRDEAAKLIHLLGKEKLLTKDGKERQNSIYKLSFPRLLLAASTSSGFIIVFSVITAVFFQLANRIGGVDKAFEILESYTAFMFQNLFSLFIVLLLATWVLSVLNYIYRFYGFRLQIEEDKLIIDRGLIEKKQLSIPFKRIQSVRIEEGPARQLLGYCNIHVHSAGYGNTSGHSTYLIPLIKSSEVEGFLKQTLNRYCVATAAVTPPKIALGRYIFRAALIPTLAGIIFSVITTFWVLPFIIIPALLYGYWCYQVAGIGIKDDTIVMRYRKIMLNTVIIPKQRIQSLEVNRNLIQRLRSLGTPEFYVASENRSSLFSVKDLSIDQCETIYNWLSENHDNKVNWADEEGKLILPEMLEEENKIATI